MDLSLNAFQDWFMNQVKIFITIVLIVLLFVTAYKRAWVAMIGVIIGLAVLGIFIVDPQAITNLSEWLAEKIGMGS